MISEMINKIRAEIEMTFDAVDRRFDIDKDLLSYAPANGGWSIGKILEHISLTNHFLLILIRKGTIKSLERSGAENCTDQLLNYDLNWTKLDEIGKHHSFYWNRPEHMEPTGLAEPASVRAKLKDQMNECLDHLNQLKEGQGVLYKTTMSVNELGKIDVYHYIMFLARHAKRHLTQMENVKKEYEQLKVQNG